MNHRIVLILVVTNYTLWRPSNPLFLMVNKLFFFSIPQEIRPRVEAVVRENLEWAEKEINAFIKEYEPKVKAMVTKVMKKIGHIRKNVIAPFVAQMTEKWTLFKAEFEEKFAPVREQLKALWAQFLVRMEEIKASGMAKTLTDLQATLEAKYATTAAAVVEWLKELNAKFEAAVKEWESYPQVRGRR